LNWDAVKEICGGQKDMWITREYQDVNKKIQLLIDHNIITNNVIAGANIGVVDRNAVFTNINAQFDL